MHIVIVGCGRVGARLATMMSEEGHDVVVIDRDISAFERLGSGFNGSIVVGTGINEDILRKAGIEKADAFAAVTSDDNTNIMAAQLAKEIFGVPRVIARIYDPEREYAYHQLGLDTVCPTSFAARYIKNHILCADCRQALCSNEIEFIEITVNKYMAGKRVAELEIPHVFTVSAVIRDDKAMVVQRDLVVQEGDRVVGAARVEEIDKIRSKFHLPRLGEE